MLSWRCTGFGFELAGEKRLIPVTELAGDQIDSDGCFAQQASGVFDAAVDDEARWGRVEKFAEAPGVLRGGEPGFTSQEIHAAIGARIEFDLSRLTSYEAGHAVLERSVQFAQKYSQHLSGYGLGLVPVIAGVEQEGLEVLCKFPLQGQLMNLGAAVGPRAKQKCGVLRHVEVQPDIVHACPGGAHGPHGGAGCDEHRKARSYLVMEAGDLHAPGAPQADPEVVVGAFARLPLPAGHVVQDGCSSAQFQGG